MFTQRPRPGRRRLLTSLMLSVFTLTLLISSTTAQIPSQDVSDQHLFHRYAARGEIHIDTAPNQRRAAAESSASSASSPSSTALSAPSSESSTPSSDLPLPLPFDTSLGSNFTANSCPTFFTNFLNNSTLKQCTSVSLLLQNSLSFLTAQRSPSTLRQLLDTACAAPISICSATLLDIARQLTLETNCGADFRARQPLVIQAYNGLVGYEAVASATCLKTGKDDYASTTAAVTTSDGSESSDEQYCFITALSSKPPATSSDPFPFYTAVGMNLPSVAEPTCNACLRSAMEIFAQWALRHEQPLAETYLPCAGVVNSVCGAGFADDSVKVGSVQDAGGLGMKNSAESATASGAAATAGASFSRVAAVAVAVAVAAVLSIG